MMTADGQEMDDEEGKEISLNFHEMMALVAKAIGQGVLDWPEEVCRGILSQDPENADAMHFLGIILHKKNQQKDGMALVENSLKLRPDDAGFWNNYGLLLHRSDRHNEAIDAFQRSIEINPDNAPAFSNLGLVHIVARRFAIADACFRNAIKIDGTHQAAYENLSSLCLRQNQIEEAARISLIALTKNPESKKSRRVLAYAYAELGNIDEALAIYKEWLEIHPDDPIAQHHYKGLIGKADDRASAAYVREIFESFADSFDAKLAKLEYKAPEIVVGMLATALGVPEKNLHIVDLGCGTGLCGPGVRPFAASLTGVDLSEPMVARARDRHCYDDIHVAELTQFCLDHDKTFDAAVCADTFCYFGDLREPFAAVAKSLRPGGVFVFTVEAALESVKDFKLHHHGRYSHSESHVRDSLALYQFAIESLQNVTLRMESGKPVHGLAVQTRL